MQESEKVILKRFVAKRELNGKFLTEFPVGFASDMIVLETYGEASSKDSIYHWRIDAVCVEGEEQEVAELRGIDFWRYLDKVQGKSVWLLEVERELNPTALGQIIVYKELFIDDYSGGRYANYDLPLKGTGIVCEEINKRLEIVAQKFGVRIFVA